MPRMCDHNWILLTTYEYERRVFCSGIDMWNVRGCTLCGDIEKKYNDESEEWVKVDVSKVPFVAIGKEYFRRLRLFAGGRDV